MKPAYRLILLLILFATGCTGAPFGDVPTARPITATGGTADRDTTAPITSTPLPTAAQASTPTAAASPTHTRTAVPSPTHTSSAAPSPSHTPTAAPSPTDTPGPTPTPLTLVAEVRHGFTNVYSGPGLDYRLLAVLTAAFRVEVIGTDAGGGWLAIRLPRGATGWLPVGSLEAETTFTGLSVMPDPPKPAPTGTITAAPEVVVSPNALAPDAKYTILIRNFQPHERITVRIVFTDNESLVFKFVINTRVDGTQEVVLTTSTRAKVGAYLVTVAGDQGSYAETRFFVGPPEIGSE